jgi:hypothetical protein
MPNWNWSSVEMRANCAASWTVWGNSPGGGRRRRPTCGGRTRRWSGDRCRPGGSPGRRTRGCRSTGHTRYRPRPGRRTRRAAARYRWLRPGAGCGGRGRAVGGRRGPRRGGRAGRRGSPGRGRSAAGSSRRRGRAGGDPEAVGQAAHGQGPGTLLLQQGEGFLDDLLAGQRAPRPRPGGIASHVPPIRPLTFGQCTVTVLDSVQNIVQRRDGSHGGPAPL